MVAAEGDELLADRAAAVGLALAALGVRHDPLHLPARHEGGGTVNMGRSFSQCIQVGRILQQLYTVSQTLIHIIGDCFSELHPHLLPV